MVTTINAPSVGPRIVNALRDNELSALAVCNCSRGTSCGRMASIAGHAIDDTAPFTAVSTSSCHS